jgi:hypothetical protein
MEPQNIFAIAMIGAIAIIVSFIAPRPYLTLRPYWERRCAGRAWRRTFPTAPRDEIRRFLRMFVEAFAFPDEHMLKFAPTDRVYDIYKAANPAEGWPDALELEILDKRLKANYGVELRAVWSQSLTLGELFTRVRKLVV